MVTKSKLGIIKPSQLVNIFGPGSLYDNENNSFIIKGIDSWDESKFQRIDDPILLAVIKHNNVYFTQLGHFVIPKSDIKEEHIPVDTFPGWGVCRKCKILQRRTGKKTVFRCTSDECGSLHTPPKTHPIKFVTSCENGHLGDFPWYGWAHSGNPPESCDEKEAVLRYDDSKRTTSSFDSIRIMCSCGASRHMGGSLSSGGLKSIKKTYCDGHRPWLNGSYENCDAEPRGIIKGATNVYFPRTIRSVSIPPFTGDLSKQITENWNALTMLEGEDWKDKSRLITKVIGGYDPKEIFERYERQKKARHNAETKDLLMDEFKALSSHNHDDEDFVTESIDISEYTECFDNIVLVKKLKEMMVLTGFSRINPGGKLAAISGKPPKWLPAIVNRGEGIFLSIKEDVISKWESQTKIQERISHILERNKAFLDHIAKINPGVQMSPRYVLLHTLSHILIRKISNFAGYSDSSIRERIYGKKDMSGILIYTSSSSTDGSLGGLVEQRDYLGTIIRSAVEQSKICSLDPLCSAMTHDNRGSGSACHACMFLPETSCESMNALLDRALIHSTLHTKSSGIGFFGME